MRHAGVVLVGLCILGAACGGDRQRAGGSDSAQQTGMAGMAMKMPSLDSLTSVRAYLDSVVAAEPRDLARMAAGHRARMERMLAAMELDMRAMNMTADAAWQALADSVRTDLLAIPGLSGEAFLLGLRAHAGRMRRLLAMHERMMGHMRM